MELKAALALAGIADSSSIIGPSDGRLRLWMVVESIPPYVHHMSETLFAQEDILRHAWDTVIRTR